MKINYLIKKFCSLNKIERGEFVKILAEMRDDEFDEFSEEIKKLVHHRDTSVGLYAMDQDPANLLYKFWQRSSDACPLECSEAEDQENNFYNWVSDLCFKIEY